MNGSSVVFTPSNTFSGVASFTYTIRDAQNATATGNVSVTVTQCPAVPSLAAHTAVTTPGVLVNIPLFSGAQPPGTISVSTPSAGTATLNGSKTAVNYTPPAGFVGSATMSYSVTTSCNAIATAVITVTINPPPTPLRAVNDVATTGEDKAVTIDVLANDEGVGLKVFKLGPVRNGTIEVVDNKIVFTPDDGFVGVVEFRYNIEDASAATGNAKVTVTVVATPPPNSPPVAKPDTSQVATGGNPITINVLGNDTDADGDPLSVVAVSAPNPPSAGVTAGPNNTVMFDPAPGAMPQTVTVQYTVSDGIDESVGTITITITNRPPVANPDSGQTTPGEPVTVDVVSNDDDFEGGNLTIIGMEQPAEGSISESGGNITFTPLADLVPPATIQISYTISDSYGAQASGILTITVS